MRGISIRGLAPILGVSESMVYKLVAAKKIRHRRIGTRIVFDDCHIDDYLKRTEVSPEEADPVVVTGFKHLKL